MANALIEKLSNLHLNKVNTEKVTKILLVEDDADNRDLLYFALTNKGYQVYAFEDAAKAYDFYSEENVDIVVSDLILPGISGLKFCQKLKKEHENIYFIAITANSDNNDKILTLNSGADDYIKKPFDVMELLARLKSAERIVKYQKDLILLNEKLKQYANTDELTGLNNRRSFFEQANKELDRAKRYQHTCSTLMLDIDNFKQINDEYGHDFGDQVIKWVSAALKKLIRSSDILCRYGGDEFLVFLPETNPREAFKAAEKFRKFVEKKHITKNGVDLQLTVTIGICLTHHQVDLSLDQMINKADKALYAAKKKGRNTTMINKWYNVKSIL